VEFGQEKLIEVIRRHRDRPAAEVVEAVLLAVRDFGGGAPLEDDVTVVAVRRLDVEGDHLQESLIPLGQEPPRG
jgi:serine phosphatase RsbU (regulator of sigma subunit)